VDSAKSKENSAALFEWSASIINIIEIILITLPQHLGQFGIRTTDFGSLKPNTSRKDGFGASPSMKTPMPIMNFIRPQSNPSQMAIQCLTFPTSVEV
jgi:hypothetical protein